METEYVKANTTPPEGFTKAKAVKVTMYNPVVAIRELMDKWQCNKKDFAAMRQTLVDMGKIPDKSSLDMTEADVQQLKAAFEEVYGAA